MDPSMCSSPRAVALLGAAGLALLAGIGAARADRDDDHGRGQAAHHRWYVSATAPAGGDGGAARPFNTLALVEAASGAGDTIVVVPSPLSVPPLDGGIALKPGQRLIGDGPAVVRFGAPLVAGGPPLAGSSNLPSQPRIANTTGAGNNGDAVELADDTEVENLVISAAFRGAIYGKDARGVRVRGNDIGNFNTSGATGFVVQHSDLATFTPGVGTLLAAGIPAGWAGILIDASTVSTSVSIADNFVHDGACGDGIDLRGMGTSDITAQIDRNFVTRLVQCSKVRTIEGIGTQVTGSARMRASLSGNTEANTGSPGANMDSLFVNPAEQGTLVETIDHNVYKTGIGGASTNGFEYIVSNGGGTSSVLISNSYFADNPGDMFEQFNYGDSGASATLILDRVTIENTTISGGLPVYAKPPGTATLAGNLGECLAIGTDGAGDTTILRMHDSSFTGCDNNGIQVTGNHATGNGDGNLHTMIVDIDNSRISGSRFYNLWLNNVSPLTSLRVNVQDSDLSQSSSGIAVAIDQQPTGSTTSALVDLGGGALGSRGRNCIFGGALFDLEASDFNVSSEHNWWGSAQGPAPGKVLASAGFRIDTSDPLKRAPAACGADEDDHGAGR